MRIGRRQVRTTVASCLVLTWCASAAAAFVQIKEPTQIAWSVRSGIPGADAHGGNAQLRDLRFAHLTTRDGLSQDNVVAILQDHRGFMWFAPGEGLNRYDGKSFVVYKNNPDDPGSLSHNFIRDLVEDDRGYLWVAVHPGVNRFDPTTERCVRYIHDPKNPNSLGSDAVWRVTRDSRGYLWFAEDNGLD